MNGRGRRMSCIACIAVLALAVPACGDGDDGNDATRSAPVPTAPVTTPRTTTEREPRTATEEQPGSGGTPAGKRKPKPAPGTAADRFNRYCRTHPGACGD